MALKNPTDKDGAALLNSDHPIILYSMGAILYGVFPIVFQFSTLIFGFIRYRNDQQRKRELKMKDVEREKSLKIDFVDEFTDSENRHTTSIMVTFFDPPLAEEDKDYYLSPRMSSQKRRDLLASHER